MVHSSSNLLRLISLTISQSSSNMGHAWSKTRPVGQIIEKPCEHSRGHSFGPIFIKLSQDQIWIILGQKSRSVGQIIEKPNDHSRGHSFGPIFIKLAQNDHLDNISVKFEYGSCWVKNKVSRSNCFKTL